MHLRIQPKPKQSRLGLKLGLLLLIGLGGLGFWQRSQIKPAISAVTAAAVQGKNALFSAVGGENRLSENALAESTSADSLSSADATTIASTNSSTGSQSANATGEPEEKEVDQLLNHRRYEIVDTDKLVPLNANSIIKLQPAAQAEIVNMIAKAKAEGVQLGIISGFRTLEDQNYLYFDLKAERGESAQTRAEVSAPPGYSEHHTGYAVDFIDESKPDTDLEESFETTAAFKWLEKNAAFFNFEMSFPKDNDANVGYEPWHWRYVGNQESLELFYK